MEEKNKVSEVEQKSKKVKNKKKSYNGFFKKLYYAIVKIEKYPEMAADGLPKAIFYFVKLVAIFAIISCLGTIYQLNKVVSESVNYLQNDFPEFYYQEGILEIKSDTPIEFAGNEQFGKIIVDTKQEDEQQINIYINQITESGDGAVILKDKVILKTEAVLGTTNYNYAELFGQMGINSFDKEDVINFINSSQMIGLYASVFLMMFIYTFIIYFLNLLTYVIFISIFGCLANLITKLRMRYVAVFNMSVYAITLSTILFMIYVGINIFVPFTIKYFEPMYISVATIYLIAAILIIKSETIKKQAELTKIVEIQKQIREELNQKEEQEKEKQRKEEKKKEEEEKEQEENKENKKEKKNKDKEQNDGACNGTV